MILGSTSIAALRLGSLAVAKVMLGTTEVWSGIDPARFIVKVNTNLRTGSTTVLIPINAKTGGDRFIDWGDGTVTTENGANPTRTYAADGIYTIQIYGGTTTRLGNTLDAGWQQTLTEIVQWGKAIGWTNFQEACRGCTQNVLVPNDIPRTADGYAANVTIMFEMFFNATAFNQNIGLWNTVNVTNMGKMFQGATAFNQNIGSWNTANVTNMGAMFNGATAFNQDISGWDIRKVVAMTTMFSSNNWGTANYDAALIAWADLDDTSLKTQAITAFATLSGGTATRVTSNGHGMVVGSRVNISGTTNYNGDYTITGATANTFDIAKAFVANDATGTMEHRRSRSVTAGFGTNKYSAGDATTARGTLTGTYLWTITDGGQV